MAFSLPALPVRNQVLTLEYLRETFSSNLTNATQIAERNARWMASVEVAPQTRAEGEALAAALRRGVSEAFYLSPVDSAALISGGTPGTPLVNGASQTGKTLVTDGWSADYELKAGDYFSFSNGTFEELHQLDRDVTADGTGNATLNLTRRIQRSPANNTALRISNPRGEFILMDPRHGHAVGSDIVRRQSFTAMEWIR